MDDHIIKVIEANLGPETRLDVIHDQLIKGQTLQKALGVTNEQIAAYYEFATELFNNQRIQDARDVILVITLLNPYIYNAWVALGMIENLEGCFQEAYIALQFALILEPKNPIAYVEYIRSLFDMNEDQSCLDAIEVMAKSVPQTSENELFFKEVNQIKTSILAKSER